MGITQALVAGIIQGVTEFIPVSSSGHLVVYRALTGQSGDSALGFTVLLHLATLLSVCVVFYKDIISLVCEFFYCIRDLFIGQCSFKTPPRRFLLMVIVGTIPAAVIGVTVKLLDLDHLLDNIFVTATFFIVTAVFMFSIDKIKEGPHDAATAPFKSSVVVGLLQAVAVVPGLSRSGSTLFGARLSGLNKEFAVKYAFILSIPVILGAGLVEGAGLVRAGLHGVEPLNWAAGFAAAFACGVVSIKFIKYLVRVNKFFIFGVYCLFASAAAFIVGAVANAI